MGLLEKLFKPMLDQMDKNESEEFYYRHEAGIERWEERIFDSIKYNIDDPDKILKSFDRALELFEKFKAYCMDKGGEIYFNLEGYKIKDQIIEDRETFLREDYPELKADFEERKEQNRQANNAKNSIYNKIKRAGRITQVELKGQLESNEIEFYNNAINKLIANAKISRSKEGGRIVFYINQ